MLRYTLLLLLTPFLLSAQNGNSPYSNIGLGDIVPDELISNTSMGGVGIGSPSPFNININPAFLPHNSLTTFELGLRGEYKKIKTNNWTDKDGNGNLRYLTFAFPISKKYSVSLGLKPLTNVSYNFSQTTMVNSLSNEVTDTVKYTFNGSGGINSIYLSQGLQLTKIMGIGLKAAYNFGAIEKKFTSFITDPGVGQSFFLQNFNQVNYRGFTIAPAIGLRFKLKKDWYLNAGGIYELQGKWGYTSRTGFQRLDPSNTTYDYKELDTLEGKIIFPSSFRLGFSFEKLYKWSLGADFKMQDWSKFKSIEGGDSIKNIYTIAIGAQFIPDANAMKGFLNRVIYRAGAYYSPTEFISGGKKLADLGFSFGASIPVSRLSLINAAFSFGRRGTVSSNAIQENYFRINLGVTISDRWFVRSKFD